MDISFIYEDKKYSVDARACDFGNIIELPDGRYLQVTGAIESPSPQITDVEETFWDESVNVFEAVVAE